MTSILQCNSIHILLSLKMNLIVVSWNLFLLPFVLLIVDSKYPEACDVYYDHRCYAIQQEFLLPKQAKIQCESQGGRFDGDSWPTDVLLKALKDRIEDLFWISYSQRQDPYYYSNIRESCTALEPDEQTTSTKDCVYRKRSICKFPTKNCQFSQLKASTSNAIFKNCENEINSPMTEITVECRDGYMLKNGGNIKCHYDGKWSHTPTCSPGCLPPKVPKNAFLFQPKETYNREENATLICNNHFVSFLQNPITHLSTTCLNNGTWSKTLPDCMSVDDLSYHYDFMKNKLFEYKVPIGGEIELPVCNFQDEKDTKVIWIRDQLPLTEFEDSETFSIDDNSTLRMSNFSILDEGIYTCVIKNSKTSSVEDFCSYRIKPKEICLEHPIENSSNLIVQEGTNQIIDCGIDTFVYKAHWFKDGQQIRGDNGHFPMPDGSLYIQNISTSDEGTYLCKYRNSFCSGVAEISIRVKKNIVCGRLDDNMNSVRPWLATLWNEDEIIPFCYATLIDSNWLVTSATCLFGTQRRRKPGFIVKLGATSDSFDNAKVYEVSKVRLHPKYSKRLSFYDVALIKLQDPVTYTNDIYPICFLENNLRPLDSCHEFKSGTTVGWGPLGSVEEVTNLKLNSEILNIADNSECKHSFRLQFPEYMFCAKGEKNTFEFAGDSGSSFEIQWKNRWYLWGVLSWGDRAYGSGDFDYFCKAIDFENWINSTMKS